MLTTYPQFYNQLSSLEVNVFLIHGDETLLVLETLDYLKNDLKKKGITEQINWQIMASKVAWHDIWLSTAGLDWFSPQKLVTVQFNQLPNKEGLLVLQEMVSNVCKNRQIYLIIVLPKTDRNFQKNAFFTQVDKIGMAIQVEKIMLNQLGNWIVERLNRQNQRFKSGEEGRKALAYFVAQVEGNLLAAHQEIQKMGLLYPTGEIEYSQVVEVIGDVARYDINNLTEAILQGNLPRLQKIMQHFEYIGESEVYLLVVAINTLRSLFNACELKQNGLSNMDIFNQLKIWGINKTWFPNLMAHIKPRVWASLLLEAQEVDEVIKGGKSSSWPAVPATALRAFLFRFCTVCGKVSSH
ncbi:MAG: DNA polymerase III subunit delta [Gammaproteobacteria bacterium]|nr:DNA polymerase III subunit delta [Gammaproteobacteria bacterium]